MSTIKSNMEKVKKLLNSKKSGFVTLYLIKYNSKNEPIIYKPIIEYDVQVGLMNIFIKYMEDEEKKRVENNIQEVEFDIIKSGIDVHSKLNINKFDRTKNLIEVIKNGQPLTDLSKLKLHRLTGYAVQIEFEDQSEDIIYFSSIDSLKQAKKGLKFFGNVTNRKVTKIDQDELVGFNPTISCYIVDGSQELLIINKGLFENVFKMRTAYKEAAVPMLNFIKDINSIENFDGFRESVLKNSNHSMRMALLDNRKQRVEKVLNNIPKVKEALTIDEYKEAFKNIEVTDSKFIFKDEYIDSFITLISDKAVESFITEEKFIEE